MQILFVIIGLDLNLNVGVNVAIYNWCTISFALKGLDLKEFSIMASQKKPQLVSILSHLYPSQCNINLLFFSWIYMVIVTWIEVQDNDVSNMIHSNQENPLNLDNYQVETHMFLYGNI